MAPFAPVQVPFCAEALVASTSRAARERRAERPESGKRKAESGEGRLESWDLRAESGRRKAESGDLRAERKERRGRGEGAGGFTATPEPDAKTSRDARRARLDGARRVMSIWEDGSGFGVRINKSLANIKLSCAHLWRQGVFRKIFGDFFLSGKGGAESGNLKAET